MDSNPSPPTTDAVPGAAPAAEEAKPDSASSLSRVDAEAEAAPPAAAAPPLEAFHGRVERPVAGELPPAGWHPPYAFLWIVSVVSLAADIASKLWAERKLDGFPGILQVWPNHVAFILAKNRGGAWGLLQGTSENVRRPFFLLVSVAAIAFIVTLYRRLQPRQQALKWGLPLVLGGALGNVFDRIRYGHVIDFIDVHVTYKGHDHHWPTFNVADIAICVGVALMAIDMFTSKKPQASTPPLGDPPAEPAAPSSPAVEPKP